jgi:FimV-like protein
MILGLLSPGVALALGLGDIHVESALHQPLAAQIEIVGATSENSGTLSASIADQETFQRYGLERPTSLASTALTVRQDGQGHTYLLLRSTDTFTEPMVTFLVDLHTTSGELIREYTVLLDPPGMSSEHGAAAEIAAEQPSPVAAPVAAVASTSAVASISGASGAPASLAASAPASAHAAEETAPTAAATVRQTTSDAAKPTRDTYTVARRDTLARIAGIAGAHSRSDRRKMMVAIFRANPGAFQTNLNNLRTGVTLHLPSVAELSNISGDAADREFAQQMAAWRSPEQRLAAAISSPTVAVASSAAGNSSRSISTVRASATVPIATAPVAPSAASAMAAASAIAAAKANTAANEAETTALTQRVESLEKSLYEVRQKLQHPPVVQQSPAEQPATEAKSAPVATRPQPADYSSDTYSSADEAPAPAPRHRMWFAPLLAKIGLMLGAGIALALTLAAAVWFYRRRNDNNFVQSDIAHDAPDLRDPDSYRAAQTGDESLPFPKVDLSASYLVEEMKAGLEHAHANAIARSESSTSPETAASSDPTARAESATSSGSTTSTQTDARSTAVMGSEPAPGIKPAAGSERTASTEELDLAAALAAAYELEASIEGSANLPLSVTPAATDTSTESDQSEAPAPRAATDNDGDTNEMPTHEPTVKLAIEPTMKLAAPRGTQETTAVLSLHPDLTLDDTAAREFAFFNPESSLNTTHVMLASDPGEAKAFVERRKNPADVLRQAIEREPERSDLRLKLLELYYTAAAQNRRAFLEAVRQLAKNEKLATPNDWTQILDMGKAIASDDELFNNGLEAVKKAVA